MALNARQRRFVEEYIIDGNAGAAVTRAGGTKNAASANTIGSRWMQIPEIVAIVAAAKAEASARNALTMDWVIERLKVLAESADKDASKIRALELLGKQMGGFKDQVEHSGPDGKAIPTSLEIRFVKAKPDGNERD